MNTDERITEIYRLTTKATDIAGRARRTPRAARSAYATQSLRCAAETAAMAHDAAKRAASEPRVASAWRKLRDASLDLVALWGFENLEPANSPAESAST